MILQSLCQLAEMEGLAADPNYETANISWLIQLDSNGNLLQISDIRQDLNAGSRRKPRFVGQPMLIPRRQIRTSGDAAFFLIDKSEYVFGFDPDGKRDEDKLQIRLGLFRDQVHSCAAGTGDPAVQAVLAFLDHVASFQQQIRAAFDGTPWAANDLFAFQVGLDDEPVHLRDAVREYWNQLRASRQATPNEHSPRCLVTGEPVAEPTLFPLLKKVPGGTSSGVSLVSFNSRAFESYGLVGNANAPLSQRATEAAATALNRLLDRGWPDPQDPNRSMPRRSLRIGADMAVCFWSASATGDARQATDCIFPLFEADETDVAEAYSCIWYGREKPVDDPAAFYVLILSGTQGRAVVRDWIETTLAETLRHLAEHFRDLQIVRSARPKKGTDESPAIPLRWLTESLAPEGKAEGIPSPVEAAFMRAAFTGTPYPFQLLQRALVRCRAEAGRDTWKDAARQDARAALIRAVLNRRRRDPQIASQYPEVPVSLDPKFDNEGYALGALMAVLERLQRVALGNVNASVVDRCFSAASAAPRSVFVRLLKNARHHARKALDSKDAQDRGLGRQLEKYIDYFCSRFEVTRDRFPYDSGGIPAHLNLEQQGLFVLGYHQMRHWLWLPRSEKDNWVKEHPDAPAVFGGTAGTPETASVSETRN